MKYLDYLHMSNEIKNKLVPKLRFPEFRLANEWSEINLGEVTYPASEKNREGKKYPIYSINNVEGFLPQSDQFEGVDSHNRGYDISLYKVINRNTFAYNPARINIGSLGYSGELHDIIISSLYVCFKTTEDIDDLFLLYFLKTVSFNKSVKKMVEEGIRSYLFYENFAKIKIQFPSITEQQKIADCLSSLDEIITAHSQKLDAFKAHKKGLMQQLFPAEDETIPKLRFPKFKDKAGWNEKIIGEIAQVTTGGTPDSTNDKYWNGDIPWMNSGDLNKKRIYSVSNRITLLGLKESSTRLIPPQCVLIGLAGQGKTRGTAAINYIELCTNQSVASIHPNNDAFNSEFLYQTMDSMYEQLRTLSTGEGGRGGLNLQIIKSIEIRLPSLQEQQKIAECLSSLDELITAQKEKVESLKLFKKGLMQGLFLALNEPI